MLSPLKIRSPGRFAVRAFVSGGSDCFCGVGVAAADVLTNSLPEVGTRNPVRRVARRTGCSGAPPPASGAP
ncbi:hypothetical protein GCM10009793_32760 [Brachybacterium phenoliresistens]